MELHIVIVVKRDAVKLEEWVCSFSAGGRQSAIQGNTNGSGTADVNAFTLLDIPKVDGVDSTALVRDNRRLHVTNQSPLSRSEEGVGLDIRGTSSGT